MIRRWLSASAARCSKPSSRWFLEGGYLLWLIAPFVITAVAVILISAGAFVYRGFARN